jgi:hypothetical protein
VGASVVVSTATAENTPQVGFLSDYDRLKSVSGLDGILCWKADNVNWKQNAFDKWATLFTERFNKLRGMWPGQDLSRHA